MQRDFTYIDDIVEGIIRVTDKPATPNPDWDAASPDPGTSSAPYRLYNIGNNNPVSLMDFIGAIEKALGKTAEKEFLPMQPGDVAATYADIDALIDCHRLPPSNTGAGWHQQFHRLVPRTHAQGKTMNVVMIGAGYVGLVSGACFAQFGANVTCLDIDEKKVEALGNGIIPIYEPGLDDLVLRNVKAGRLQFSTQFHDWIGNADLVFIAVGTPSRRGDGHADLKYVYAAATEIATHLHGYTVIVDKSTVPVGTAREVKNVIQQVNPNADFDVASNPEFLREGSAISDFMRPDRVVLGVENERAANLLRELYRPLNLIEAPILVTDLESAEITKYAANAFLATKISFINEVAELCEKTGADVHAVAKGSGWMGALVKSFYTLARLWRILLSQRHSGDDPNVTRSGRFQPYRGGGGCSKCRAEIAHGEKN